MTLELAHQLALTKLVELLQTLTDPAEIRRVATAILRIKPPKNPTSNVPPDTDHRETAGAEPPQAPTAAHAVPSDPSPSEQHDSCFPDDLTDDDLESVRQTFISRDTPRAHEFRAMTLTQFRSYLRGIFSYLHTQAAQLRNRNDDDDA